MAVVWNIPIACNRASVDFMISSPLMDGEYDRLVPDYDGYRTLQIVLKRQRLSPIFARRRKSCDILTAVSPHINDASGVV